MKRIFAIFLAVLMMFSFSGSVSAKTLIKDGDWLLEANENSLIIDSYIGSDADVTLINTFGGLPVVAVGENAFLNNINVGIIVTNDSLTVIGSHGFNGCTVLREVILTSSLTGLGVGAFANTPMLQKINLSESSVETIPAYCFAGSGISSVSLPDNCIVIGNYAFQNCASLTSVMIPGSVTEIADNSFDGCDNLSINAPHGSYAIEYAIAKGIDYAYSDYSELTFVRGDADGDGNITIMDATKIQRLLAKFEEDTDGMIALRSTLSDEGFGIMDATRIQRKIALYDDPYRIGEGETVHRLPDGTITYP